METFTLDPHGWQIFRIIGRNPLLRRCDRVEALVALLAIVVVLVATPLAGLAGSVVYTARDQQYAQESLSRHVLTQTVISAGPTAPDSGTAAAASQPPQSTAGEGVKIWVDQSGNPVPPPTPAYRAVTDAAFVALTILLGTAIAMSCLLTATRWRIDRARDAQWDREIRCLEGDDGRRNQS